MDSLPNEISTPVRRFRSFVFSLALLLGAGVPGRALTPNGPHPDLPPQREILLNGLRVAVLEEPGDRVAVVCAVRAGAMFDPTGKSGLANVTAGLLLRGAGSYSGDRIRGEIEDAGATLNVHTDWDATWIEASTPAAKLAQVLDVISLMVSSPTFAPEDVEAVKKAALERVSADLANAGSLADRTFAKALYGPHTYGRSIWGDAASISSISPGDVKVFYNKFYVANAAVVGVAGPVTADTVMALARARFGRWEKSKVVPATFLPPVASAETRVVVVDRPGATDAVVRAGFWTVGRSSADAAQVTALAERLGAELTRTMGAGTVSATYDLRALQSPLVVAYAVPAARLDESIRAVADAVAQLRDGRIPEPGGAGGAPPRGVLEDARAAAAADFFAAQNLTAGGIGERPAADAAGLAALAKSTLGRSALTVVVVGDAKTIAAALKDKYKIEVVPAT